MIKAAADGTFSRANLRIEIERLLADLRRLRDGGPPTTEENRAAPCIDRRRFAGRQVTCLSGAAYGHLRRRLPYVVLIITALRPRCRLLARPGDSPVRSRRLPPSL